MYRAIKVLLPLVLATVSAPAFAEYFICPQTITCNLSVSHGVSNATCQDTPSGWQASFSSWVEGTTPLPATVKLYFISAQNFPNTGEQANCNYYQPTSQGGFYNVQIFSYSLASAPPDKANWQSSTQQPYGTYYWCYSSYMNAPTTESDAHQCPFTLDSAFSTNR